MQPSASEGSPSKNEVVASLVEDLKAEAYDLQRVLDGLADEDWKRPTPAEGWSVHDQVCHLAHFDHLTRQCIEHPDNFVAERDGIADLQRYIDSIGPLNAWRSGVEVSAWWRAVGADLRSAALTVDPSIRVPWFGPPMSVASKLTARIMETWAHGQDIVDTFGLTRMPTNRLRHVARIGVLAFDNSFRTHGHEVPDAPVRVELTAPDGVTTWAWGAPDALDSVRGGAEDFCLVVTQRRHLDDTRLKVSGSTATSWMSVAQAFAGPPGPGRSRANFNPNT